MSCLLKEWVKSDDVYVREVRKRMKAKYDKYWRDVENKNNIICVVDVLDPRFKFGFVKYALIEDYGEKKV